MDSADDGVANLIAPRLVDLTAAYVTIELAIGILEKTSTDESDAIGHLKNGLQALTRKGREAARRDRQKAEPANDVGTRPDTT